MPAHSIRNPIRLPYAPLCGVIIGLLTGPFAALDPAAVQAQDAEDERPPGWDGELADSGGDQPDEPLGPTQPWRVIGGLGGGASFRIVQNLDFAQDRFAPGFIEAFGAVVFPTAHAIRHGAGLGVGLNLTGDGSYDEGIDPITQLVLAPHYQLYWRLDEDFVLTGKVGVPFALTPEPSVGLEVAPGAAFMITAGLGLYVELSLSTYLGAGTSFHPFGSAEGGIFVDYEVLP